MSSDSENQDWGTGRPPYFSEYTKGATLAMAKIYMHDSNEEFYKEIPDELPIFPLRKRIAFPFMAMPLTVKTERSMKIIKDCVEGSHILGLVGAKDPSVKEPMPGRLYEIGTVGMVHRWVQCPDGAMQVFMICLERFCVDRWLETDPYPKARIVVYPDSFEQDMEVEALFRTLKSYAYDVVSLMPSLPDGVGNLLETIQDPRYLVYLVATNINLKMEDAQNLLETNSMKKKMKFLIGFLSHEKEILKLRNKIQTDATKTISKEQHDYYLRQQLKAIRKELGEEHEEESVIHEYTEKIEKANLPDEANKEALRELKRLGEMSPHAAEYSVIKTYLDWILDLPWNKFSQDHLDIVNAREVLDQDHHDLQDVKERILEYLAVRQLIQKRGIPENENNTDDPSPSKGAILCFIGPPGVGKTSLGQSIARALGRKFTRMSLGGLRDEAEIRGHRRTYIGAMPGRIIQAIKRAGTRNPVFMLDEVDKIGNDWRGDPSSALLEVLDPMQNHTFRDHYLDIDFNLNDVIFITTGNQIETIPPALKDRMEILYIEGYTEYEKILIARDYLVKRQLKNNGLTHNEITFTADAFRKIIQSYTRESGVRNLEREIGSICRKAAVKILEENCSQITVTSENVRTFLKKEKYESEVLNHFELPGIATGLSVTAVGGDIIFIEVSNMKGSDNFILTGHLGTVMKESAQIAYSYVRSNAEKLKISSNLFKKTDVHIHIPEGAIPKDGPSAGITLAVAMASLFSGRIVDSHIAMTGEITLRGRILKVGGIKMKLLAAHRFGLKTVIIPEGNKSDLEDLPEEVLESITVRPVSWVDEAMDIALQH